MYNPQSLKAEEFISHDEVLETLDYAARNRSNAPLIDSIIEKAEARKELSVRKSQFAYKPQYF